MKPETIGRVFGIGVRVAGRVAGQRLSAALEPDSPAAHAQVASAAGRPRAARANLGRAVGGLLQPFRRVGGILWLEVTGAFFLLPALVFAPTLWRTRASAMQGPDHRTFVAAAVVVVVFFYLSVTSFWRARKR